MWNVIESFRRMSLGLFIASLFCIIIPPLGLIVFGLDVCITYAYSFFVALYTCINILKIKDPLESRFNAYQIISSHRKEHQSVR
jgi:hypothetical protein